MYADPGDWHLHALLSQLVACIESRPADRPTVECGEISDYDWKNNFTHSLTYCR